jgi:hypothetical protein
VERVSEPYIRCRGGVHPEENGEKARQLRSRPSGSQTWRSSRRSRSKASTYVPIRLDLLTACGLASGLFHHSLEGREGAEMVLGTFAETKVPRRRGRNPAIKNQSKAGDLNFGSVKIHSGKLLGSP